MALIAAGLWLLVVMFQFALSDLLGLELLFWFGGGALIGAGFGTPFRHHWRGAAIGAGTQLLFLFAMNILFIT